MAYSNATFFVDLVSGSNAARTALTSCTASNPSGTITRINKAAHGLVTGAVVDLTLFTAWLNSAWKITKVDNDNFDLDGAVWQATADNSGTATPRGGSSKADAWQNITSGATAARVQAGDVIRVMSSPDPTSLGINATWTQDSKTVTLASALTANITDCETAWTAATNVTATADTAQFKENAKSAKFVTAAGFTTGLMAYFNVTADLSAYQQVSFWVYTPTSITIADGATLSLRLCTSANGVYGAGSQTIAIPAVPSPSRWIAVTVDFGGALTSNLNSIAIYADKTWASKTVQIDNILACKASASADSLSLTSLVGKINNLSWVASTGYPANSIRRPTQPNRNGYCYKVTAGGGGNSGGSEPTWPMELGETVVDGDLTWTCYDLEDTWYPIQSINSTTVMIDNNNVTLANAGKGYSGDTETVTTYKREPIALPMITVATNAHNTINEAGAAENPTTYSGGWNRTDMTTQTGETWMSAQNGYGYGLSLGSLTNLRVNNFGFTKMNVGLYALGGGPDVEVTNCHASGNTTAISFGGGGYRLIGIHAANSSDATAQIECSGVHNGTFMRISSHGNNGNNTSSGPGIDVGIDGIVDVLQAYNNRLHGVVASYPRVPMNRVKTRSTAGGTAISALYIPSGFLRIRHSVIAESNRFFSASPYLAGNPRLYSENDGQVEGTHLITWVDQNYLSMADMSTISTATDRRHVASGSSWKFNPKNTSRYSAYPMFLSIAKIAVLADSLVTIGIWCSRDSANIKGRMCVRGGQIAGVPSDQTVACEPTVDAYFHQYTLSFTPTELGVVEVLFEVWDGVGTTNSFWIHDFSKTQA